MFKLFAPGNEPKLAWMVDQLALRHDGKPYYLAGKKEVRVASIFKMWSATTTLYTRLHEGSDATGPVVGAGVLTLGIGDLLKLLSTFHATNAASLGGRLLGPSAPSRHFPSGDSGQRTCGTVNGGQDGGPLTAIKNPSRSSSSS